MIPRQGKGKFITRGKKRIIEEVSILFTKDDSKGIQRPHDDALIVAAWIGLNPPGS